jgi:LytTr DNA-binding domain
VISNSKYRSLLHAILVALYFAVFIFFINPFKVYHSVSQEETFLVIGICTGIFFMIWILGWMSQKIQKSILSSVLIPVIYFIALVVIFYGEAYFDLLLMALGASIVPVFLSIIFSQSPSTLLTLQEIVPDEMRVDLIKITGTNQNEEFELEANKLIAFEANDNYVNISFLDEENKHQKKVFRTTLKSISQQLSEKSNFLKIHRSVIINTELIEDLLGNSQSRKVKMKYGDLTFPVSRNIRVEKPI